MTKKAEKWEEWPMALIKCPECGKEVSDLAKTCVGCGYPIQKWLAQQAAQEAAERAKAAREEKAARKQAAAPEQAAENPDDPETVPRRRKKKWFIIGGAAALAAMIAVVLILVLVPKNRVPEFSLSSSMTDEEIIQYMKERGYDLNKILYKEQQVLVFSVPEDVLGFRPSAFQILKHPDDLELSFAYLGKNYNIWEMPDEYPRYEDVEDLYGKLKKNATALYGQPIEGTVNPNVVKSSVWNQSINGFELACYEQDTDMVVFSFYVYK